MLIARSAVLLIALTPTFTLAESIASTAASSASTTASSASDSLGASSNSSKSGGNTARAGDYRIEAVAAAEQAGKVRLVLEPLAPAADGSGGFVLTLPQAALQPQRVARGDTVRVRERAYGFEFARADTNEAFFLMLTDASYRELDPRPVAATSRAAL
jgi:hypothetical protein